MVKVRMCDQGGCRQASDPGCGRSSTSRTQMDGAALAQARNDEREASGWESTAEQPLGEMPRGQGMSTVASGPGGHRNVHRDSDFSRMGQASAPLPISSGHAKHRPNRWCSCYRRQQLSGRGTLPLPTGICLTSTITALTDHWIILQWGQWGQWDCIWPTPRCTASSLLATSTSRTSSTSQGGAERPSSSGDPQCSHIQPPVMPESPRVDAVKPRTLPSWIR